MEVLFFLIYTSTFDRNGLSTSAELTGVSIATNGPNGFQLDEINFAEQNINAAQDKTQDDPSNRDKNDDGSKNADADDNDFFRDMGEAGIALAGLLAGGAGIVTGLFGGGTPVANGGNANPLPTNTGVVAMDERARRREDEEGLTDLEKDELKNLIQKEYDGTLSDDDINRLAELDQKNREAFKGQVVEAGSGPGASYFWGNETKPVSLEPDFKKYDQTSENKFSQAGSDGIFNQWSENPFSKEYAEDLKKAIGSDADADTLKKNWCAAISLWQTLRTQFPDLVEANFIDFAKKHVESGSINKNTMLVSRNDTITYSYQDSSKVSFNRKYFADVIESPTREDVYSNLANTLKNTKSDAIILRVHEGHSISFHRDGSEWRIIDTGNSTINGTKFDPHDFKKSRIYSEEKPYGNKIPTYVVQIISKSDK